MTFSIQNRLIMIVLAITILAGATIYIQGQVDEMFLKVAYAQDSSVTSSLSSNTTAGNQTGGILVNLTAADFTPIKDSLLLSRQNLLNRDYVPAYEAAATADSELFRLNSAVTNGGPIAEELSLLQTHIQKIFQTLKAEEYVKGLARLNAADYEIFVITGNLSSGPSTVTDTNAIEDESD